MKLNRWVFVFCLPLLLLLTAIISIFYMAPTPPETVERVDGVVRVLMHQPDEYTIMIKSANSSEIAMKHIIVTKTNATKFLADVSAGEDAWVKLTKDQLFNKSSLYYYARSIEFHIHSVKEVDGGGWEKREGRRSTHQGQTNIIE